MTGRGIVVAVDGPSGTGKSTVSRQVASRLQLSYLDTGAMYRAATWWSLHEGVELDDQAAVAAVVRAMPLEMITDPHDPHVVCAGTDITEDIRAKELTEVVSKIATNLEVRAELKRLQREILAQEARDGRSAGAGVVAEGRDITTVVAPDADVRILLTASESTRLARRAKERHGVADLATIEATRDEVLRRDADDSTVSNFMTAADGVLTIDTSELDISQVVEGVLGAIADHTTCAHSEEAAR
ncbi:(d)CMP kinase [Bogoriella caseilytica]|uniref:Cytidylate kinase n=1 Tax=Bogoriella caseilytica TaxID=56055 RepID=A0A3N2BGK0_9MICO|nr:(d)CMP kinase [Bogoriella caseilytica]ROR74348.1 cytidylate kinase [Bogoriella caseilytica]